MTASLRVDWQGDLHDGGVLLIDGSRLPDQQDPIIHTTAESLISAVAPFRGTVLERSILAFAAILAMRHDMRHATDGLEAEHVGQAALRAAFHHDEPALRNASRRLLECIEMHLDMLTASELLARLILEAKRLRDGDARACEAIALHIGRWLGKQQWQVLGYPGSWGTAAGPLIPEQCHRYEVLLDQEPTDLHRRWWRSENLKARGRRPVVQLLCANALDESGQLWIDGPVDQIDDRLPRAVVLPSCRIGPSGNGAPALRVSQATVVITEFGVHRNANTMQVQAMADDGGFDISLI